MSARELRDRIRRRARHAGLTPDAALLGNLERYYLLLARWNQKINLTSFALTPGGSDEAVDRLLIEPVMAAQHVPSGATTLVDAGSGGGSPAIPLKLAHPHLSLRMIESKMRKSVFLTEASRELGLTNTKVETARFEELLARPDMHEAADLLSIRAVRVEARVLMTLQAFLKPGGHMLLFRGPGGADLSDSLTAPLQWIATYPLVDAARSRLVILRKSR
ncbi:MAG: 16S rRNA (guanine(527)-N(7))-methyltransferase RsmG [Vicinamibacterales bacterium]|nr:16S rRNA (guanine(527)-N(7))-methyltransferase RsmG [Vicinamibacterales bacterium]